MTASAPLPPFAARAVALVAFVPAVLLLAVAARYGYHRDELYFLAAGHHLAWGYADQPPFVAVVARVCEAVAPHSLVLLRSTAAIAAGGVVMMTGLLAREFGGGRDQQVLAAVVMACGTVLYGAGHLMGTTIYNLLAWSLLSVLVLRRLRRGDDRRWLVVGVTAGLGLFDNTLVAFLLVAMAIGVAAVGPRRVLASRWLSIGGAVALVMWLPYLVWQARHGWPQLAQAHAIAAGKSGSSQPRWAFIPFQLLLVSPWLTPVWLAGLVRLWRDPLLEWARCIPVAYGVLTGVFIATGGKPYYIAGLFPALIAAGALPTVSWLRQGPRRRVVAAGAVVLTLPSLLVALPILPLSALAGTGVVSVNYDLGEQVAWPTYAREIAAAYRTIPTATPAQIVTSNYGEAGAIARYGASLGLPNAYSGQTGYWYWGPPPEVNAPVLAIGVDRAALLRVFRSVRPLGELDNHLGLETTEQHVPMWLCEGRRMTWRHAWPLFKST